MSQKPVLFRLIGEKTNNCFWTKWRAKEENEHHIKMSTTFRAIKENYKERESVNFTTRATSRIKRLAKKVSGLQSVLGFLSMVYNYIFN